MDIDSYVNLLILNVFNKLDLDKCSLIKVSYPLVGLRDKIIVVLCTINLPLVLGDEKYKRKLYAEFIVVDIPFVYNLILDRLVLNCYGIVINMSAICLKLPALRGIAVVRGNPRLAKEDVTRVDPALITHKMFIDKAIYPVQQKKRRFAPERQQVIKEEANKLLNAGFIKEVQYPTWLANVVLVKKANRK
ncbi:uncharacterized protein LOC110629220 [Manihot esculenta]|uniref:uncharacterized protein LOC110629220 n=1 Tax=Manihot esculenta TaxID=3983 RepID=UPI000B5D36C8|nr:uncharacterized protein LOC110629220 [Manihot esculenta]